ncbi:MAG: pyridoxamine 5'-phosphate oxidase [Alphaproteobacteria bacterium]
MTEDARHKADDFGPPGDPFGLFRQWYEDAVKAEPNDPNAAALATVGADGMPAVRMVLVKDFSERGFTFFTNYASRKADHLGEHPQAALCMHWKSLSRQIRIEGDVVAATEAESDAYFASRTRDSRLSAWASLQSRPLAHRDELEARVASFAARFPGEVPRPPHWGGFLLRPRMIEFWSLRPHRLHDRLAYTRQADGSWTAMRLYP